MTKQIPSYLKLVTDTTVETPTLASEDLAVVAGVAAAFQQATGWRLRIEAAEQPSEQSSLMWSAPVNPGVGTSPGHIRLFSCSDGDKRRASLEQASALATSVGHLWAELIATRHALRQREAELATGVPMVIRNDEQAPSLCDRLEAVLRAGAEAAGCDALALYMLDPATTELKLRASWGLPQRRLAEPPRPLRGALADLEALLGHAVVLSDRQMHDYWKVPEQGFEACVCVPVSNQSEPLGTLWAFSRGARDFSDAQTNVLEVVAGRIASDLEREVLVDEALLAREQCKQVRAAQQAQCEQLPSIAPLIDGWDVAASATNTSLLGGAFYDWFALADGALSVVAGDALETGLEGALAASSLHAAARALAPQRAAIDQLLDKANAILWAGSAGNRQAGLVHAMVEPRGSQATIAAAGPLRVLAIDGADVAVLAGPEMPLGRQDLASFAHLKHDLPCGGLLLIYGAGSLTACDERALKSLDTQLALALKSRVHRPARELVGLADEILGDHPILNAADRVTLVIKRKVRA